MRKILFGFMGLALTASVVGGTAFALFSDTATVSGISINASSADLQLSVDGENFQDDLDLDLNLSGIYPGYEDDAILYMRNNSAGNFGLDVTARLTHADGWGDNLLRNYVMVKVENLDDGGMTDYQSLAWWNADVRDLPGHLDFDDEDEMKVYVKLAEDAPEGLQEASLENITFEFVGTQIVPDSSPDPTPEPTPSAE